MASIGPGLYLSRWLLLPSLELHPCSDVQDLREPPSTPRQCINQGFKYTVMKTMVLKAAIKDILTFHKSGIKFNLTSATKKIIELCEEYHQSKSKEEAEKRYMKAFQHIIGPFKAYTTQKERADRIEESLRIASGKEEEK